MPESIAKSAPNASGCWPSGVQTVLSTATSAPAAWAASATAAMSTTSSRGFDGVSNHTSAAPSAASAMADVSAATSRVSHAQRREPFLGQAADPGVAVPAGDEHVAGAQRAEQHRRHRRHARGEDRALAAVELAERALEVRPRRVAVATVAVRRRVLGPAQVVRRGEHRPGQQRVALLARGHPGVDRARARAAHGADDSLAPRCRPASSRACCSPRAPCRRAPRCSRPGRCCAPPGSATTGRCSPRRGRPTWPSCSSSPRGVVSSSSSAPPPAGPPARCCSRDPKRRLTSFDPVVREHREAYLALLPRSARERLELVPAPGHEARGVGVALLFVDSSHDRDATSRSSGRGSRGSRPARWWCCTTTATPPTRGWRRRSQELGLSGREHAGMWVWEAPA